MQQIDYGPWKVDGGFVINTNSQKRLPFKVGGKLSGGIVYGVSKPWNFRYSEIENIITGICLFDARWTFSLEARVPNRKDGLSEISLETSNKRRKLVSKLEKGHKIIDIKWPVNLGLYHMSLIRWQIQTISMFKNVDKVLIHVPLDEYVNYIYEYSNYIDSLYLYEMEVSLKEMVQKIKRFYLDSLGDRVVFIEPLCEGLSCVDSYKDPYINLDRYELNPERACAVEDITEFRLLDGSSINKGLFAVLDRVNRYFKPIDTDYKKIRISTPKFV